MNEFLEILKWRKIVRDGLNFYNDNLDNFPETDVDILATDAKDGKYRIVKYHPVYFDPNSDGVNGINHVFVENETGSIIDVVGWTYILGPAF